MNNEFIIDSENSNRRLDLFVSEKLNISRSQLKKYCGPISVNGEEKKLSYSLKDGDTIIVNMPSSLNSSEDNKNIDNLSPKPENIPIEIIYEDKHLLIINKKEGMSVHCSPKELSGTLVNALLYHVKDFDFYGDTLRAGIIHRLDKDTSGLIIVGKNANIVSAIQLQFKNRTVKKIYYAITSVKMKVKTLNINLPIGRHHIYRKKMTVVESIKGNIKHSPKGKEAITLVESIKDFKNNSLIKVNLKTGRTHQIRVHLSYKGYPIAGDKIYSKTASKYNGLMLHAKEIEFVHPITKKVMRFNSELPERFINLLNKLE